MTTIQMILLSDDRVAAVPVRECGEPLVRAGLRGPATGAGRLVRAGVATRLAAAQASLPPGYTLRLVEGYRSPEAQQAIIAGYATELRRSHPSASAAEIARLCSRYVAPMDVAPHPAGAAVDVTLAGADGRELWLGSVLDATPEDSDGACFLDAPGLDDGARRNREILRTALEGAGLVNYPTEWWHWSFGDRYWALLTGAARAVYGPLAPQQIPADLA